MLIELGKLGQHAKRGGGRNTMQVLPTPVTAAQAVAVVKVNMGIAIRLNLAAAARGIADISVTSLTGPDSHFRTVAVTVVGVATLVKRVNRAFAAAVVGVPELSTGDALLLENGDALTTESSAVIFVEYA
jgi:hypothetical protein